MKEGDKVFCIEDPKTKEILATVVASSSEEAKEKVKDWIQKQRKGAGDEPTNKKGGK